MTRKPLILITLISLIVGCCFYLFVPKYWKLDFTWEIKTGEDISLERIQTYHQKWGKKLEKQKLHDFIQEQECNINTKIWRCVYLASDYKSMRKLKKSASAQYREISGWVDPIELNRSVSAFEDQIQVLQKGIPDATLELEKLKKKVAPKKERVEKIVEKRDLYQQNSELRKKQIEILSTILPSMDKGSELYQAYVDEKKESSNRLKTITTEIQKLDQRINREASELKSIAELEEKIGQWTTQVQNQEFRKKEFLEALKSTKDGKAPHPREYAFLLQEEKVHPRRSIQALFSGILSSFFLFSNFWLVMMVPFQKRTHIQNESIEEATTIEPNTQA